jgi:hypothetical protein
MTWLNEKLYESTRWIRTVLVFARSARTLYLYSVLLKNGLRGAVCYLLFGFCDHLVPLTLATFPPSEKREQNRCYLSFYKGWYVYIKYCISIQLGVYPRAGTSAYLYMKLGATRATR